MIVGQNSLLNQFVPTFYIKDLVDGQGLVYSSIQKAFINSSVAGGAGGATKLGELLDVSDSVDNPLSLQDGQALVYNGLTGLWENQYIDWSDIANAPLVSAPAGQVTYGNITGSGLASSISLTFDPLTNILTSTFIETGTLTTDIISGYTSITFNTNNVPRVVINLDGSISFSGNVGAAGHILTSNGAGIPPTWQSISTAGTVTSVSAAGNNGILTSGSPITTSGTLVFGLGNITPTSVAATGTVTGSNLTGTHTGTSVGVNTGDQIITLTGDVNGGGTGTFATILNTVNTTPGTFGSSTQIPVITVDGKGRITSVFNMTIGGGGGSGTVTSVAASGGTTNMTFTGSPITTSGILTLSGTLNVSHGGTGATDLTGYVKGNGTLAMTASATIPGSAISGNIPGNAANVTNIVPITNGGTGAASAQTGINNLLPPQAGLNGRVLSTNGTNVSWVVSSGVGTVTSVAITGNNGISVSGSPITTNGTFTLGLGAINPTSVASTGPVTGSNLSGSNTGDQIITLTGDVVGTGTTGIATNLIPTGVAANTYGDATHVPQFTVDTKGRITNVTNIVIDGSGGSTSSEKVVLHYSSGSAGNFTGSDVIFSQSSGVSTTIIDPANCVATYSFTGKSSPPISITVYGQNYTSNTFSITNMPGPNGAQANIKIEGGGTSSLPNLANGIFTVDNFVTLQTTMAFTGASSTLGNRAWLIIIFGF